MTPSQKNAPTAKLERATPKSRSASAPAVPRRVGATLDAEQLKRVAGGAQIPVTTW